MLNGFLEKIITKRKKPQKPKKKLFKKSNIKINPIPQFFKFPIN